MRKGDFFKVLFRLVYFLFAILHLIIPFYVLYKAFDSHIFHLGAYLGMSSNFVICFILLWLLLTFACLIVFRLWWKRKSELNSFQEFIVLKVISHFIKTFGDTTGMLIGVAGFGFALLTSLFFNSSGFGFSITSKGFFISMNGAPPAGTVYLSNGWVAAVTFPILGLLIILVFRLLSESIRALASLANHTAKV